MLCWAFLDGELWDFDQGFWGRGELGWNTSCVEVLGCLVIGACRFWDRIIRFLRASLQVDSFVRVL
jgi:hypothetical protein